jgi:hypothetical protein
LETYYGKSDSEPMLSADDVAARQTPWPTILNARRTQGRAQCGCGLDSPFRIDPTKFERVRIVQDLGIDAKEQLPKDQDGTKVLTKVLDATDDSLFPLQGALGDEIQQTLFVGPNSLVVEGPADMLYLRAASAQLEREGRTGGLHIGGFQELNYAEPQCVV